MEEVKQVRGEGTPEKYERTVIGFNVNLLGTRDLLNLYSTKICRAN